MAAYPKTETITLNGGQVVKVIDYTKTPPPDKEHLRCLCCGIQRKEDKNKSYESQCECEICIVSGQLMMGHDWNGWDKTMKAGA